MRVSVILAHPDKGSFNHAIAEATVEALRECGHEVTFHDLYEERFDCVLPGKEIPREATLPEAVRRHCEETAEAEGIVIVHPNWWGQPPAILKGWIDRVIRPGVAYEFLEGDKGDGVPRGLLAARAAIVFTTSNTPVEREQEVFGDPLETLWKNCVFGLCGVKTFERRNFGVVVTSIAEERRRWLAAAGEIVRKAFPLKRPATVLKGAGITMEIRRMEAGEIGTIAFVNREETIDANYAAQPTEDGWGLTLKRVACSPPVSVDAWDKEQVEQRIGWWAPELEKGGALIGAFDGERLAGFVVGGHRRTDGSAELSAIFVDRDYRGKGIGTGLMRAAEEEARARGVGAMYIMSVPTANTVDFYMRRGYRIISIIDKTLTPNLPWDVVMAKPL